MPQMLRLSQGHWLNLEQIVEVYEERHALTVVCAAMALNEDNHPDTYTLYLMEEERLTLLAWLAQHSACTHIPRAHNDDEPPF